MALQPGSGYDLGRLAERSVGYLWTPSRSQIYKVLPRLVAHRLATAKTVHQQDRPDKAVYETTPAGRQALQRWLSQVEEETSTNANIFALKLFFCDLAPPPTALAQLDGYRRFLEVRLAKFHAMRRPPAQDENVFPQLVLTRAIVRINATLTWIDEARAALAPTPAARPDRSSSSRARNA